VLLSEQWDRDLGYAATVSRARLSRALVALALACATKPPAVTAAPEPTTALMSTAPVIDEALGVA
jgi:ABC-type dipeptide/oligopeptide/nickel transport system ATPase component